MIFTRPKRGMKSYIYVFGLLVIGFVFYFLIKDKIFDSSSATKTESFEVPAPASIEIRQAPIYPPRVVMASGPNPPSQEAPNNEVVIHGSPEPKDPYYDCLLYTSPSPRDRQKSRMPSSA